jgi:hypothetical protein
MYNEAQVNNLVSLMLKRSWVLNYRLVLVKILYKG